MPSNDPLASFGIYKLASQLFDDFWQDSEILGKDYRGRELVKQQVRSLDSICANIEEGYGRYERCKRLLPAPVIEQRTTVLNQIIGGLTKTINTLEGKGKVTGDE